MKYLLRIILVLLFIIVFIIPGYTYFYVNKNITLALIGKGNLTENLHIIFRFFGLYALTFEWGQIILGPFMAPLEKLFSPKIFYFHRAEGVFTLLFALTHASLFYIAYLLTPGHTSIFNAIGDYLGTGPIVYFGYLGPIALILMILTLSTAFLMNTKYLQNKWHKIHLLNYLVFILVFTHSFVIGTETKLQPLHNLYIIYGLSFIAAVTYKFNLLINKFYKNS